ncbi:MAG: aminopeptidase P N-terminal domain-containing protein [Burkholderiaceae bacterium]
MASLTTPSVEFDSTAFFEQLPERHRPEPVAGPVHGEAHRQRRQALARAVAARSNGRPVVILAFSGKEILRNRDNPYAFRFNSDFFYLTGFPEPDAWLVIRVDAHGAMTDRLYCLPRDPEREIWDGVRVGPEKAAARYFFDESFSVSEIDKDLPELLIDQPMLVAPWAESETVESRLSGWLRQCRAKARAGKKAPSELLSLGDLVAQQRLRKDEAEIQTMRQAAAMSAKAHCLAMQATQPGLAEHAIEAVLLNAFRGQGAESVAYGSIVASGPHSCILHHRAGHRILREGEMLLIDAGCELHGYASDITRSFPVSGRFSPEQRAVYDIVLAAQEASKAATKPGAAFTAPHEAAVAVLCKGLIELGLLPSKTVEEAIETESYKTYYMHRTGHWLGMDVHDVGDYSEPLAPGMVLTLEPGLYLRPSPELPEAFWNIGIRIEDDALVTEQGCELITRGVPVDPQAIEDLMAGRA